MTTMDETDACYLPATQLVDLYQWKTLSPVEVTKDVLARINADFNTALRDAAVRQRLLTAGAEADPGTQQQMRERLSSLENIPLKKDTLLKKNASLKFL